MKIKTYIVISLIIILAPIASWEKDPPTPIRDVKVSSYAELNDNTGIYTYHFTITNPSNNELSISRIYLDVAVAKEAHTKGDWASLPRDPEFFNDVSDSQISLVEEQDKLQVMPFGAFMPYKWKSGFVPENPTIGLIGSPALAYWGSSKSPISPGTALSGFSITSYGLPGIREMSFAPNIMKLRGLLPSEWYPTEEDYKGPHYGEKLAEALRKEEALGCKATTIGPYSTPVNLIPAQYTQTIQDYIDRSKSLDWILDPAFAESLTILLSQIHQALLEDNYLEAQILLQQFMQSVENATPEQQTSEAKALLYHNAKFLYEFILAEIPESIDLQPLREERPINSTQELSITIQKGNIRVPGFDVSATIVSGPHEGIMYGGWTDENGVFTFSYTGEKTGTDKIIAS